MIERHFADPTIDFDGQELYWEHGSVESAVGLVACSEAAQLDDIIETQRAGQFLSEEELIDDLDQEYSKKEIDRIRQLNAADRADEGQKDGYRTFSEINRALRRNGLTVGHGRFRKNHCVAHEASPRNKKVLENVGLVGKIAGGWWAEEHLKRGDLFQNGIIGLIRAAEKFDPGNGAKFSAYAAYWIKQAIQLRVDWQERTIRWPTNLENRHREVERLESRLRQFSAELPVDRNELVARARQAGMADTEEIVDEYLSLSRADEALEDVDMDLAAEEDEYSLIEFRQTLLWAIEKVNKLKWVNDIAAEVIIRHHGLFGCRPETLKEIGADFNCTGEYIRQIEKIALEHIEEFVCHSGAV